MPPRNEYLKLNFASYGVDAGVGKSLVCVWPRMSEIGLAWPHCLLQNLVDQLCCGTSAIPLLFLKI